MTDVLGWFIEINTILDVYFLFQKYYLNQAAYTDQLIEIFIDSLSDNLTARHLVCDNLQNYEKVVTIASNESELQKCNLMRNRREESYGNDFVVPVKGNINKIMMHALLTGLYFNV